MNTTTKPKRSRSFSDLKTRVIDKLNAMEMYQTTSSNCTKIIMELKNQFNVPSYCWQYINGYVDCRRDYWSHNKLEHCYIGEDNKPFRGKWNDYTEEQREYCRQFKNKIGGFFWVNKDGSLGKPYFVCDNTNEKDGNGRHIINDLTQNYLNWNKE
jgi:hypothetical protein